MERFLVLETTFVVDLEREALEGETGAAHVFLDGHPDHGLAIALTTAGELACGPAPAEKARWQMLIRPLRVLAPDLETAWHYGQVYKYLRRNGLLIGANDLWIAATALTHGLPVVTRNLDHYRRVPGLDTVSYGSPTDTSLPQPYGQAGIPSLIPLVNVQP